MSSYRHDLPQLAGGVYLTDAGLETDLIFNHGFELPAFAAHTLLADAAGRHALARYFRGFLALAERHRAGFVLDAPTWRAHPWWAEALGVSTTELAVINREAVGFVADLRDEFAYNTRPVVLNAVIGPCGDAYSPEVGMTAREAEDYHAEQLSWLAETEVEMVTAMTFHEADEAIGLVRAASRAGLPAVVSFTTETDGALPNGQTLGDAIDAVDSATGGAAAYFMVNCAHPDHFSDVLDRGSWTRRLRGIRCNASRCSHAELDEAETLDTGDVEELAALYAGLAQRLPWLNVFGGCCGSDLRHVTSIAATVEALRRPAWERAS